MFEQVILFTDEVGEHVLFVERLLYLLLDGPELGAPGRDPGADVVGIVLGAVLLRSDLGHLGVGVRHLTAETLNLRGGSLLLRLVTLLRPLHLRELPLQLPQVLRQPVHLHLSLLEKVGHGGAQHARALQRVHVVGAVAGVALGRVEPVEVVGDGVAHIGGHILPPRGQGLGPVLGPAHQHGLDGLLVHQVVEHDRVVNVE